MTIEMEMEQGRTSAVKEETEHELSRLPALVMIPAVESMKDILLFKYWFTHPSRYNQQFYVFPILLRFSRSGRVVLVSDGHILLMNIVRTANHAASAMKRTFTRGQLSSTLRRKDPRDRGSYVRI